jgi:hypothetical protein
MYAQSTTRQASVATVLVAALAGIIAASIGDRAPPARLPPAQAAASYPDKLPQLPEVVVTASRVAS